MTIKIGDKEYFLDGYLIDIQKIATEVYQQGRADAIDKCLKIAKCNENMWDGGSWTVREIEELKENNNDNN